MDTLHHEGRRIVLKHVVSFRAVDATTMKRKWKVVLEMVNGDLTLGYDTKEERDLMMEKIEAMIEGVR